MSSVPMPSGPSTSGAATSNDAPGDADRFSIPDLCTPLAVFAVVLSSQLLALLLTLAGQPGWFAFYSRLAQSASCCRTTRSTSRRCQPFRRGRL